MMDPDGLDGIGELLSAYLDGELDEATREQVAAYLKENASAAQQLEALRAAVAMLQVLPREAAPPELLEDVMAAAERQALVGGAPRGRFARPRLVSAAAVICVLVTMGGSYIVWQGLSPRRSQVVESPPAMAGNAKAIPEVLDGVAVGQAVNDAPFRAKAPAPPAPSRVSGTVTKGPEVRAAPSAPGPSGAAGGSAVGDVDVLSELKPADEVVVLLEGADLKELSELNRSSLAPPATGEAAAGGQFSNAPIELTVSFTTADTRDQFAREADSYLSANAILNAADPQQRAQLIEPEVQSYYYASSASGTADQRVNRQYLINAPPEQLGELLTRAQAGQSAARPEVQLRVGNATYRADRAAEAAQQLSAGALAFDRVAADDLLLDTTLAPPPAAPEAWEQFYRQLGAGGSTGATRAERDAHKVEGESSDDVQEPAEPAAVAEGPEIAGLPVSGGSEPHQVNARRRIVGSSDSDAPPAPGGLGKSASRPSAFASQQPQQRSAAADVRGNVLFVLNLTVQSAVLGVPMPESVPATQPALKTMPRDD